MAETPGYKEFTTKWPKIRDKNKNPYMKNVGLLFASHCIPNSITWSFPIACTHRAHEKCSSEHCGVVFWWEMGKNFPKIHSKLFLQLIAKTSERFDEATAQQLHGIPSKVYILNPVRSWWKLLLFFSSFWCRSDANVNKFQLRNVKMSNSTTMHIFFVRCDSDAKWRFANVIRCSEWINYAS